MRSKKRFGGPRRGRRPEREHRINEEITASQVRLITDEGAQLVSRDVALAKAREQGVDLVEIARNQDIPVVKIIDYGKFKFEKAKKEKENKKKQKVIHVKEIKLGPKIDVGDFDRKVNMARDFLNDGDQVKVNMRFRGREMAHTEIGLEKMIQFKDNLEDIALVDKEPKLEGRVMTMVLRPKGKSKGSKKAEG